jgi:hypothetical protein
VIDEGKNMTVLNNNPSAAGRHPAGTTLLFGAIGFLCGFVLSLILSAYSLYACTQLL